MFERVYYGHGYGIWNAFLSSPEAEQYALVDIVIVPSVEHIRGPRKFCQRGSKTENVFFFFFVFFN